MRSPSEPFAHQGGVVVLAHRGFSGRYPENTMLAYTMAAELPVDGLEMDIYPTRDGKLVISHDESVERTTDGHGNIQDFTLAELKKLDAGYRFSPDDGETYPFRGQGITIPTLEEVLNRFPDLWINVDIKQHEPEVVELFCSLIKQHDAREQLCVGSFSSETVEQFRKTCPGVVTLATIKEIARLFALSKLKREEWFEEAGHPIQISPQEKKWGLTVDIATERFLEAAHHQGSAVHLWTLDDPLEMEQFVDMGIDGIITNYPNRALRLLGRTPY